MSSSVICPVLLSSYCYSFFLLVLVWSCFFFFEGGMCKWFFFVWLALVFFSVVAFLTFELHCLYSLICQA